MAKSNGLERDTLDNVIIAMEKVDAKWHSADNQMNYCDFRDALFYLKELQRYVIGENAKTHLFGTRLNNNIVVKPEGIYCAVCGTRLDLEEDD